MLFEQRDEALVEEDVRAAGSGEEEPGQEGDLDLLGEFFFFTKKKKEEVDGEFFFFTAFFSLSLSLSPQRKKRTS